MILKSIQEDVSKVSRLGWKHLRRVAISAHGMGPKIGSSKNAIPGYISSFQFNLKFFMRSKTEHHGFTSG
jgi:hypothetical protein